MGTRRRQQFMALAYRVAVRHGHPSGRRRCSDAWFVTRMRLGLCLFAKFRNQVGNPPAIAFDY